MQCTHGGPLDCVVRNHNDWWLNCQKLELPRCQEAMYNVERSMTIGSVNCNLLRSQRKPCACSQWLRNPTKTELYWLENHQIESDGGLGERLNDKVKAALMTETKRNCQYRKTRKRNTQPALFFTFWILTPEIRCRRTRCETWNQFTHGGHLDWLVRWRSIGTCFIFFAIKYLYVLCSPINGY